ncbi:MAG: flippase-like domain-containing protein [Limnochordaceae bacterium]|nr:flippase-like domain-containing protein [Limnochordaceae bacterium]
MPDTKRPARRDLRNHHGPAKEERGHGPHLVRNLLVGASVTVLTLGLLLKATWAPDSWRLLTTIRLDAVGAALGLIAVTWAIGGLRAWLMTRSLGYPIPYSAALRATLVGAMVSGLTPFTGGGGAAEALVLSQAGIPYAKALATVNAAGVLNQSVLLVASLALAFSPVPLPGLPVVRAILRWVLVVYALGLLGVVAALLQLDWLAGPVERLLGRLERVMPAWAARLRAARTRSRHFLLSTADAFRTVVAGRPAVMAVVGAGFLVYYLLIFLVAPILANNLGGRIHAGVLVAAQFPLFLVGGVLPTPGASGGIEAGMAAIVAPYLPRAAVGIFVSVWRLLTFYPSLMAGAVAAAVSVHRSAVAAVPEAVSSEEPPGRPARTGASSLREPV